MPGPLWTPSAEGIARANLTRFGRGRPYAELYDWSITEPLEFWDAMWDFGGAIGTKGSRIALDMDRMPGARFFPDATLNFAENVLRSDAASPAIIFKSESGASRTMSWRELRDESAAFAAALRAAGIRPGDRVAAYLPNVPEAIVAVLGAASVGPGTASRAGCRTVRTRSRRCSRVPAWARSGPRARPTSACRASWIASARSSRGS